MTGKKQNASTYKVMNSAKRKAAAEASVLKNIQKVEGIKNLKEKLKNTEETRMMLAQEEQELLRRKERHCKLKEENQKYRREINTLTSVNKFTNSRNKDKIRATLGEVKECSRTLHSLNERVLQRESHSRESFVCFMESFMQLLHKESIKKDLIAVRQPHTGQKKKNREECEERKRNLMKHIEIQRGIMERMTQLDEERQSTNTTSLEDYMDAKLGGLHKEIQSMNEEIKNVNSEMDNISKILDKKLDEVANIKLAIKNKPNQNVTESKAYQKVLQENMQMKAQLDEYLTQQDELAKQTCELLNLIDVEKRRKTMPTSNEIEIEELIVRLQKDLDEKERKEDEEEQKIRDLQQENYTRDEHIQKMKETSKKLKAKCHAVYGELQASRNQVKVAENENEAMISLISDIKHHTSEILRKKYAW